MYWSSKQLITGKFIHVFINKPIPPKRHYTEERCYNKLCRNATETLWKERWSIFIHLSLNRWKSCRIGGMLTKVHFFRALRALNHVWSTICAVLCQERTHTMCVSLQKYLPLGLRVYIVGRDECTHFVSVCVEPVPATHREPATPQRPAHGPRALLEEAVCKAAAGRSCLPAQYWPRSTDTGSEQERAAETLLQTERQGKGKLRNKGHSFRKEVRNHHRLWEVRKWSHAN